MNWYGYAGGNPIGMVDPHGLGISSAINAVQTTLSFLGMTPVFGAVFDVVNAGISIGRGNYAQAGFHLASAIPGIGDFAAGAKMIGAGATAIGGYRAYSTVSHGFSAARTTQSTTALTKYWPDNNGFVGGTAETFLYKGQKIDRYGGGDWSRFFSPQGTPDFARALPPGTSGQLRTFEVMKPFPVQSGQVAPAFGQIGGGTQMVTPVNLRTLLGKGILREVGP
jgi:hypothetical protein